MQISMGCGKRIKDIEISVRACDLHTQVSVCQQTNVFANRWVGIIMLTITLASTRSGIVGTRIDVAVSATACARSIILYCALVGGWLMTPDTICFWFMV